MLALGRAPPPIPWPRHDHATSIVSVPRSSRRSRRTRGTHREPSVRRQLPMNSPRCSRESRNVANRHPPLRRRPAHELWLWSQVPRVQWTHFRSLRAPDTNQLTSDAHRCERISEPGSAASEAAAAAAAAATSISPVAPSEVEPRSRRGEDLSRDRLSDSHDDVLTGQDDGEQGAPRGTDHRPGMLPLGEILSAALPRRAGSDAAAAETMHAEPYGEWDYQSLPPSPPPHRPRFRRRSSTGSWCPVTRLRPRRIVRSLLPPPLSLSLVATWMPARSNRSRGERERERERERDSLPTRSVPPLSLALSHAVFARENQEEGEGGGERITFTTESSKRRGPSLGLDLDRGPSSNEDRTCDTNCDTNRDISRIASRKIYLSCSFLAELRSSPQETRCRLCRSLSTTIVIRVCAIRDEDLTAVRACWETSFLFIRFHCPTLDRVRMPDVIKVPSLVFTSDDM